MAEKKRYRGRIAQVWIYLGKQLRMFVFQNDWKMLPMAALIGGLVTFAVGTNMFIYQEGTMNGCFALTCVCVWNGFFNSIQVICRERPIIKREHRAGMHISSYIAAHMIYQMLLCALQTVIILGITMVAGIKFPAESVITGSSIVDFGLTMFLVTYTADMLSLAISAIVKNTTAAMTVMPFVLMFQLIFSGALIVLQGPSERLTDFTITKWGLQSLCAQGNLNTQPQVTLWNTIWEFRAFEWQGQKPVKLFTDQILKNKLLNDFLAESGKYTGKPEFALSAENVLHCWMMLAIMAVLFAVVATLSLELIDRDKR